MYIFAHTIERNMAGLSVRAARALNFPTFACKSTRILQKLKFINISGRYSSNTSTSTTEQDPAPIFFNEEVQKLLKTLTRPDPKKVFRVRKDGHAIKDPEYKFMTDEELKEALKKAYERLDERLQMPPVVKEREEINEVLSKDPALQGHDQSKYIFTDITFGISNVDRLITVRDIDGTLRKANWDERFRMNQIYFPTPGREMFTPKMFEDEHLQEILKQKNYEFILDRACIQFEPDDPQYQRIVRVVYDTVNSDGEYDKLRSTRHYGPFVFHLAMSRNIDSLLYENITKEFIEDAALLIKLFLKLHPTSKSAEFAKTADNVDLIQKYVELDSAARGKLTSAINAYKELAGARKKLEEGIKKAHGLS